MTEDEAKKRLDEAKIKADVLTEIAEKLMTVSKEEAAEIFQQEYSKSLKDYMAAIDEYRKLSSSR